MAQNKPTFITLPVELRTMILEYACYHDEMNGYIAPTRSNAMGPRFPTLLEGKRTIIDRRPIEEFETENDSILMESFYGCDMKWMIDGHICTERCLLQPAISMVCLILREEALPIFYSVNNFHLELANFQVPAKAFKSRQPISPNLEWSRRNEKIEEIPMMISDWWRAIGDTNLRSINSLTVVGGDPMEELQRDYSSGITASMGSFEALSVRYKKRTAIVTITRSPDRLLKAEQWASERNRFDRLKDIRSMRLSRDEQDAEMIKPFGDILATDGLHVRLIEHLVARLEPTAWRYLRDRSELETPFRPVAFQWLEPEDV